MATIPTMTSRDFLSHFGEVMNRVYRGEEIHITRYGRPFVRLLPPVEPVPQQPVGPPSE